MRTLFVQTLRELRSIFYTPVAYVVMTLFCIVIGYNFYAAVKGLNGQDSMYSVLDATFINPIFIVLFAVTSPLITMRTFSEEYRMGTIETLTTAPIQEWQVVLSKFIATVIFYAVLFLPTILNLWIFQLVGGGLGARSIGTIASTYLILLLIGTLFVSFGLFASSLVRDQINAALISIVANLAFIFVPLMLSQIMSTTNPKFERIADFVSPLGHMFEFSKGTVDTRRIIWYLSVAGFFIVLTNHVFHSRKLKQ